MRKLSVIVLMMMAVSAIHAQTSEKDKKSLTVELGYVHMNTNFNRDSYLMMNYPGWDGETYLDSPLKGANLKFTLGTKYKNIDLIFGAMMLKGSNESEGDLSHNPPIKNGYQYRTNGGGIYAGISPKWKTKYFGLTSDFAVGIFPFKEYYSAVISTVEYPDFLNINVNKGSVFGGMASAGFYVNVGRFGINPTANIIFAGGNNTSFMFWGFVLPLYVKF